MGILILCVLVVLVSLYLTWQNYVNSKKEESVNDPIQVTEKITPNLEDEINWVAAPPTPIEAFSDIEVPVTPEVKETKEEKIETAPENKPKRGRKSGSQQPKDSYKKKGGKRGPKPKKDKGNDLLLS